MWPEVAGVISFHSGQALDVSEVGQYFRSVLHREFSEQLRDLAGKKYVAVCIDQAGVGSGRARLIKEFFGQLIASYDAHDGHQVASVASTLQKMEQTHSEEGISQLHLVLEKSGVALLNLASLFERGLLGESSLEWDWESIRHEYKKRFGSDLRRLMPEAKEAFQEIFPSLRKVMRRDLLKGLERTSAFSVELPTCHSTRGGQALSNFPLGYVVVKKSGFQSEVEVVDEDGRDARTYASFKLNRWSLLDGRSYYVADAPFQVIIDGFQRSSSFPVFSGHGFRSQTLSMHAWSNSNFKAAKHLEVEGTGNNLGMLGASLQVYDSWHLVNKRLRLHVHGFKSKLYTNIASVQLRLGSQEVWKRNVGDGGREFNERLSYELPYDDVASQNIQYQLWSEEHEVALASVSVSKPTDQTVLLIDETRILLPSFAPRLSSRKSLLMSVLSGITIDRCEGASVQKMPPIPGLAERHLFTVTAEREQLSGAHLTFDDGSQCFFGITPDFIRPLALSCDIGNVRASTQGNLEICSNLDTFELAIANCVAIEVASIRISIHETEVIFSGEQLLKVATQDKNAEGVFRLALGVLVADIQLSVLPGIWKIELICFGVTSEPIYVLVGNSAEVTTSRLGDRSGFKLIAGDQSHSFRGEASSRMGIDVVQRSELKIDSATHLSFSWLAKIIDVVPKLGRSIVDPNDCISIDAIEQGLMLVGVGLEERAVVWVGDCRATSLRDGETVPVRDLLANLRSYEDSVIIEYRDMRLREYQLGALATVDIDEVLFSAVESVLRITNLHISGFLGLGCRLKLESDLFESPRSISMELNQSFAYETWSRGAIDLDIVGSHITSAVEIGPVEVVVELDGYEVARTSVDVTCSEIDSRTPPLIEHDIDSQIKNLVANLRQGYSQPQVEQIVRLYDLIVSNGDDLPYPPERVGAAVMKSAGESYSRHTKELFHLIATASAAEPATYDLPIPSGLSFISLCYGSYCLINEVILDTKGLRDPKMTADLATYFFNAGDSSTELSKRKWCGHILALAMRRFPSLLKDVPILERGQWIGEVPQEELSLRSPTVFLD